MILSFIYYAPALIIASACFLYLTKTKSILSYVLFGFSVVTPILIFWQNYVLLDDTETDKTRLLSMITIVSSTIYFIQAIGFLIFIKSIIKPKHKEYDFLEDSRDNDAKY